MYVPVELAHSYQKNILLAHCGNTSAPLRPSGVSRIPEMVPQYLLQAHPQSTPIYTFICKITITDDDSQSRTKVIYAMGIAQMLSTMYTETVLVLQITLISLEGSK